MGEQSMFHELISEESITGRFVRYTSILTQSAEGVPDTPSTPCQRDLAELLHRELADMGIETSYDEEKCYVYATLPGNLPADKAAVAALPDAERKRRENLSPIIGLVAHMDTSDAVDAKAVHPRVIRDYDGTDIVLDPEGRFVLSVQEYPDLLRHRGETIVVTDGTSVLGGDDKAGVVQIMEVLSFFSAHPEYPHPTIRVMFTPDEEVGNGTLNVDYDRFACDFAYTVDGGRVGELEYENFNAASMEVGVRGRSTHPGDAKDNMINALQVGMEFHRMLPAAEVPEHTQGYEGFYHLTQMEGTSDSASMSYILRDHDRAKLEYKKETASMAAKILNERYGEGTVRLEIRDSYSNMAEKIRPHMHLIDIAGEALRKEGIEPIVHPIRGGTDGANLSYRGIPCPNLGTGAYNFHSRYEYASMPEIKKGVQVLIRILTAYAAYQLGKEDENREQEA